MNRIYLGIDPGAQGGLAVLLYREDKPGLDYCATLTMPSHPLGIVNWLREIRKQEGGERIRTVLEQVGGYVAKDEGVSGMGPSMFNFGRYYGWVEAALSALGITWQAVVARKWQGYLGLSPRKGESRTDHKNRMKRVAQEQFPGERVTLKTADALLLALYAKKTS